MDKRGGQGGAGGGAARQVLRLGFLLRDLQREHPRPAGGAAQRGEQEGGAAPLAGRQGQRLH